MENNLGFLIVANRVRDGYDTAPRSNAQLAREEQAYYERFEKSRGDMNNDALKAIASLAAVFLAIGALVYVLR
jgi:hypothetical protein